MVEHGIGGHVRSLLSVDRLVQFGAIGFAGAVVDMLGIVTLHGLLDVTLLPAKLVSAEAAIVLMFACNEHWTFDQWGHRSLLARARRLATSNVVRLGGLLTGVGVLIGLTDLTDLWYPLANGLGLAAGFIVNYVCESLLTWRVHRG